MPSCRIRARITVRRRLTSSWCNLDYALPAVRTTTRPGHFGLQFMPTVVIELRQKYRAGNGALSSSKRGRFAVRGPEAVPVRRSENLLTPMSTPNPRRRDCYPRRADGSPSYWSRRAAFN